MPHKYELVKELLTKEEANQLKTYALELLKTSSPVDGITTVVLHNRPDTWDPQGNIEKGFRVSDTRFRELQTLSVIESTKFFIRKIDAGTEIPPFVEIDTSRDAQVHEVHRKIAVLSISDEYEGGETNFENHGESFKLEAGDLIMYEVDDVNKVGVNKVTSGFKLEVIYWYAEVVLKTRFDEFYMPPMENASDRF